MRYDQKSKRSYINATCPRYISGWNLLNGLMLSALKEREERPFSRGAQTSSHCSKFPVSCFQRACIVLTGLLSLTGIRRDVTSRREQRASINISDCRLRILRSRPDENARRRELSKSAQWLISYSVSAAESETKYKEQRGVNGTIRAFFCEIMMRRPLGNSHHQAS